MKMVCAVLRVWPIQHPFLLGQLSDNVRVRYQPLKLRVLFWSPWIAFTSLGNSSRSQSSITTGIIWKFCPLAATPVFDA